MAETSAQRNAMAYYKAGHVVVAWYYGIGLRDASVRPGDDNLGRCLSATLLRSLRPGVELTAHDREQLEAHVRCVLAGAIAQRKFDPHRYDCSEDKGDRRAAVELLSRLAETEEEVTAYCRLLAVQTRDLLDRTSIWMLVEAVASKLIEQEELSSTEREDLIRTAAEQLKWGQP
jgi:hypothetical protein